MPALGRVPPPTQALRSFVGVAADAQTYRNVLYLALSFPLGVLYLVALSVGLSFGFGALQPLGAMPLPVAAVAGGLLVGVALLSLGLLVVAVDRLLVLERLLAKNLLGLSLPTDREREGDVVADYVRAPFTDVSTWAGIVYLGSRFFIGILLFVLFTIVFTLAASMVLTPLYYDTATWGIRLTEPLRVTLEYAVQFWDGVEVVSLPVVVDSWTVSTLWESLVVSLLGGVVLLAGMHLANLLATVHGWYTTVLTRPRPLR